MAPLPASRRPFNTRARRSRPAASGSEANVITTPSSKRRRYVPGGPGGGGRYVDTDGTEIPVGGTGPGGYNYVGPRGRIGRENAANGIQPVVYERPRRESRREQPVRPRFSSAAAATAAAVQGDGFKPREERSWEEFHRDLDIEAHFPVFCAEEVDGITKPTSSSPSKDSALNGVSATEKNSTTGTHENQSAEFKELRENEDIGNPTPNGNEAAVHTQLSNGNISKPMKRRPGRPPRRPDFMLKGIGTPDAPKIVPLPGPNPREKLTLPKPSFRPSDPFVSYEAKAAGQLNYVDRTMANVGYQESDIYIRPEKTLIRITEGNIEEDLDIVPRAKNDGESNAAIGGGGVGRVEYDMDEQDEKWLEAYNIQRKAEQIEPIKPAVFEITMTKIEKEWHALEKRIPKPNPKPPQTHRPRSSSAAAVNGETAAAGEEQDSKCAICDDGDCENTNAIVFCDGCDLAVHQECYGVPFIPEGQWLCRKCQLIGRGTPTCIFCPNTDGAFKQTNASRWSHLLCAIWIPEVSLGNATFMEPVMDVEKVPRQRWKLTCYICRQKMGACIQCGNKNCFVAFHVTCARRANLYLKMKSTHGGPASFDASVLRAFCDKHVPSEWRRNNDVDAATTAAIEYYHYAMRGRLWADSQQAAMAMSAALSNETPIPEATEEACTAKVNHTFNVDKRNRNQSAKVIWRLPSGAPVIPAAVYNSVESSLQRFTIRKRKEYAAEACKYWTLKREARRGAALLKRLQLQMETFTSMEITRRNYVGMGAAGRVRLQRRIDFAEKLHQDVAMLRKLGDNIKKREEEKLKDAEMLKDVIDTVYFPISPLLWPILEKAQALDGRGVFQAGLSKLRENLSVRLYTSVSAFSADFGAVFSAAVGLPVAGDTAEVQAHISSEVSSKETTAEYKETKKLAKRIVKAVQGSLEDALRKEGELCRRPFEKELRDLVLLDNSVLSRRDSLANSLGDDIIGLNADYQKSRSRGDNSGDFHQTNGLHASINETSGGPTAESPNGVAFSIPRFNIDTDSTFQQGPSSSGSNTPMEGNVDAGPSKDAAAVYHSTPERSSDTPPKNSTSSGGMKSAAIFSVDEGGKSAQRIEPPSPPLSSGGDVNPFNGGVPWYMAVFDPVGTTIEEERWTGRELVRGMSEELSDMDEEELCGLVDMEMTEISSVAVDARLESTAGAMTFRKSGVKRKRWRGYR